MGLHRAKGVVPFVGGGGSHSSKGQAIRPLECDVTDVLIGPGHGGNSGQESSRGQGP